jgi:hypothetical protein
MQSKAAVAGIDPMRGPLRKRGCGGLAPPPVDLGLVEEALDLLEIEYAWWRKTHAVFLTRPGSDKIDALLRYTVNSTSPRPER